MTKPITRSSDEVPEAVNQKTMLTQTQTRSTQSDVEGHAVLETNGNAHRMVWYAHNADGTPKAWDPFQDLSLLDLKQSKAGLEAIAKMTTGGLHGVPTLTINTPTEKLAYLHATGTFGYLFPGHTGDIDVDVNGTKILLRVDPADVPNYGIARVHMNGSELYRKHWEEVFTARDADPYIYWYATACSVILSHRNVSVSIGPKMMDDALAIVKVLEADDKLAADSERRYGNRRGSALKRDASETKEDILEVAKQTGVAPVANPADLMVPVFGHAGEMVDLGTWPKTRTIPVCMANGLAIKPMVLREGDVADRQSIAKAILKNGYFIDKR